ADHALDRIAPTIDHRAHGDDHRASPVDLAQAAGWIVVDAHRMSPAYRPASDRPTQGAGNLTATSRARSAFCALFAWPWHDRTVGALWARPVHSATRRSRRSA